MIEVLIKFADKHSAVASGKEQFTGSHLFPSGGTERYQPRNLNRFRSRRKTPEESERLRRMTEARFFLEFLAGLGYLEREDRRGPFVALYRFTPETYDFLIQRVKVAERLKQKVGTDLIEKRRKQLLDEQARISGELKELSEN